MFRLKKNLCLLRHVLQTPLFSPQAVAIVPQLVMVHKIGRIEPVMTYYLVMKCFYRVFYIMNWIYRYYAEGKTTFCYHR